MQNFRCTKCGREFSATQTNGMVICPFCGQQYIVSAPSQQPQQPQGQAWGQPQQPQQPQGQAWGQPQQPQQPQGQAWGQPQQPQGQAWGQPQQPQQPQGQAWGQPQHPPVQGGGWENPNGQQNRQYAYGAAPQGGGVFDAGPSGKSRGVAGILAILLGGLGVHYFYMGKSTAGIVFLLISLLSCGLLAAITGLISLIQGIMFLTQSQAEFEKKYVNSPKQIPLF